MVLGTLVSIRALCCSVRLKVLTVFIFAANEASRISQLRLRGFLQVSRTIHDKDCQEARDWSAVKFYQEAHILDDDVQKAEEWGAAVGDPEV